MEKRTPWAETKHGLACREWLAHRGRNLYRARLGVLNRADLSAEAHAFHRLRLTPNPE